MVSDLARLVFGLSYSGDRLDKLGSGSDDKGANLETKKDKCLPLLTSSLLSNGMKSLEYLESTPFYFVSVINRVPFCGC